MAARKSEPAWPAVTQPPIVIAEIDRTIELGKMPPALKHKAKEARGTWTGCLPPSGRILAITALSLMFTASFGAFAQDFNEPPATFNERFFPADQTSTQPSFDTQDARKEQNLPTTTRTVHVKRVATRTVLVDRVPTATRLIGTNRARSRVVVVPRGPRCCKASGWVARILRVGFAGPTFSQSDAMAPSNRSVGSCLTQAIGGDGMVRRISRPFLIENGRA